MELTLQALGHPPCWPSASLSSALPVALGLAASGSCLYSEYPGFAHLANTCSALCLQRILNYHLPDTCASHFIIVCLFADHKLSQGKNLVVSHSFLYLLWLTDRYPNGQGD